MTRHDDLQLGIIGGSGLGEILVHQMNPGNVKEHLPNTPFGKPSSPISLGTIDDVPVALLKRHGDGHVYDPSSVPYRANIYAMKALGCTHVLASGATGSLREDIAPGELVLCDQIIDRTDGRPRTFYRQYAVHVEFAEPFCPVMRQWLLNAASQISETKVHGRGTYICIEGPSFSTRAESHMHRQWGADVVGMTAMPEARLAREAEIAYALIAIPTDYDCWRQSESDTETGGDQHSLLQEIICNLQRASEASIRLIQAALKNVALLREQRSPAHDALSLGIWTDKSQIDPEEVERLRVLWGTHFQS